MLAGLGEATQMKICEMPLTPVAGSVLRLDQQWVTRKIPLRYRFSTDQRPQGGPLNSPLCLLADGHFLWVQRKANSG